MVSPELVCEWPLPAEPFRSVFFRSIHAFFEIVGESSGVGVPLRGSSISPFLNGSSSGVRTLSTSIASVVSELMLVRRLDDLLKNDGVCGVGGEEPMLDENVVLVPKEDGVESFEELVITDRFSFDRERNLLVFNERGRTWDIRSARVWVDFTLDCWHCFSIRP
jgi:hypothetical protein